MRKQWFFWFAAASALAVLISGTRSYAQPGCDLPYCIGGGSSSQEIRLLTGGVERARVDIGGSVKTVGAIRAADGTSSLPSYSFDTQSNTGFTHSASNIGVSVNATATAAFTPGALSLSASGGSFQLVGVPVYILTAPTISSGFGASPSIVSSNVSATFRVNVGTGGVATTGVVGLPAATNGWNCVVVDITNNTVTRQTANTTTTVTVTAAAAWAASDVLLFNCVGF